MSIVQTRLGAARRLAVVALACSAMLLVGYGQEAARANVTAVSGNAYGYFSSVSLFGSPRTPRGPAPTVTLPAAGSAAPVTANAPTGNAQYGPAIIFTSGALAVSTRGGTGARGSVTSSANVQNVNRSGQEVFTASNVSSTCTASQAGVTRSTTIINGGLLTSGGGPGYDTFVPIPRNPAPNTTYNGTIAGTGDRFRYVFNEQIVNPNGLVTVNAAHQYLLGPLAVGDLVIGRSVCGVAVDATRPLLSSLSVSPSRLRAARTGTSIAPRGTRVSYRLSEPAVVRFRVERAVQGRRVRGRCVTLRRSNRRARRCTRYVTLGGAFTHRGKAGQNRFRFRGRLRGRKLRPGRYRLRAVATDLAGNKSRTRRDSFRIVRR